MDGISTTDKKRKLEIEDSENDKKKNLKVFGIDGEAEESGDDYEDDGESDGDLDYADDGFVVRDESQDVEIMDDYLSSHNPKNKLKKLKKNTEIILDEEDELLIQDNIIKNIDNDDSNSVDNDEEIVPTIVVESDNTAKSHIRRGYFREEDDGSDMEDFIVRDVDDKSDEDEDAGEFHNQQIARNTQRRSSKRDGPTFDQIQEAMDIFGPEYDFDDEDDENCGREDDADAGDDQADGVSGEAIANESASKLSTKEKKLVNKLRTRFERTQLVASFCTDNDESIRLVDSPERLQEVLKNRETPQDDERRIEAEWIATKLADALFSDEILRKRNCLPATVHMLQNELLEPVAFVLKGVQVEQMEVPFLWLYRRDYLHPLMERKHLWLIYSMDEQWETMYVMKVRLQQMIQALSDAAEGSPEEDDLLKRNADNAVINQTAYYNSLLQDVIDAEQWERRCMDVVDGQEDHTQEDRDNVRIASEKLETLQQQLNPAQLSLDQLKASADAIKFRIKLKAKYSPVVARETMRQFPVNRYLPIIDSSTDEAELKDIYHFVTLLMHGAEAQNVGGSEADIVEGDSQTDVQEMGNVARKSLANQRKILGKKSEYLKYKAIRPLKEFAEKISVPAHEFGDCLRHGFRLEPPDTHTLICADEARLFIDNRLLHSEQAVIRAASVMIATELSAEPSVRREARRFLKEECTVSSKPTEKGMTSISPFSEYFGLHFINRKPVRDMLRGNDRTMFVRMVEAERLGIITVSIDPPMKLDASGGLVPDLGKLFMLLMPLFLPSQPGASNRQTWDTVRLEVLQLCLEKYLLPSLQDEFRRELLRVGREAIVEEAAENFGRALQVGPHRFINQDARESVKDLLRSCPRRPNYSSVAAVYQSSVGGEPLFMAFVNKDGVLRAHDLLPTQAANQKMDRIKQFLFANRPDLIVLNASGGFSSRTLAVHIEKNVLREVSDAIEKAHRLSIEERERNGLGRREEDEEDFVAYSAQVMVLRDEVATIFKGSTRAKTLFPDLQPGCAAAISLARFAQEPLAEYCGLWTAANATEQFGYEALFLELHPLKALLKGSKMLLLRMLERKLVDAVCDVGVDINKAASLEHIAPMLAFVCGLGLRKADALRQNIRRSLGVVESRNSLLVKKLLGRVVWTNASGFLRIGDDGLDRHVVDPLDNTRIHPECYGTYDFAPKICADALEVDNTPTEYADIVERLMKSVRRELEKRMKKHPKWVDLWEGGQRPIQGITPFNDKIRTQDGTEHPLTIELHDSLSQLMLDDYAADLENQGKGKRRLQLEHIKEELRFPWLDLRLPLRGITPEESFAILTGETDFSLHVGLKLGCTVNEISDSSFYDEHTNQHKRRQRAVVKTDSGLRGFISIYDVTDDRIDVESVNLSDFIQCGVRLMAVVIKVNKDKLSVDLSIKPSHLAANDAWWMDHRESDKHAREWWENVVHKNPSTLFDQHFEIKNALDVFKMAEISSGSNIVDSGGAATSGNSAKKSSDLLANSNRMLMRTVHHPLFANVDFKDAEDKLRMEGKGAGEVVIRPSSKGADFLTITWAFQENWFKHISVREEGKRSNDLGLGARLFVMESDLVDEAFSDLDEIHARYIEPMNDLVAVMVSHRNFLSGSVEEVEARMQEQLLESPNRIPYFIRFEPNRPGAFVLTWLSLNSRSSAPVKKVMIEVRPYGYKINSETFARPSDLISWFKKTTEAAAAASRVSAQKAPSHINNTAEGSAASSRRPSRFNPIDRHTNGFPSSYGAVATNSQGFASNYNQQPQGQYYGGYGN